MYDDIVEVWVTPRNNSGLMEIKVFYTKGSIVQMEKFELDKSKVHGYIKDLERDYKLKFSRINYAWKTVYRHQELYNIIFNNSDKED